MKIVQTDNFDRDSVSEELVAENVPIHYAYAILNFLIDKFTSETGPHYYKIEKDDYQLYTFEP